MDKRLNKVPTEKSSKCERPWIKVTVEVSDDGDEFVVAPGGTGRPTDLTADSELPFTLLFQSPVPAHFVRITVLEWTGYVSVRAAVVVGTLVADPPTVSRKLSSALSVPSSGEAETAVTLSYGDGSLEDDTGWCAAADDHDAAIVMDLGSEMEVMGVVVRGGAGLKSSVTPSQIRVSVSGDGGSFVPAVDATFTIQGNSQQIARAYRTVTFTNSEVLYARYVKIEVLKSNLVRPHTRDNASLVCLTKCLCVIHMILLYHVLLLYGCLTWDNTSLAYRIVGLNACV